MQVFKFGGASVKDAEAVRNVKSILQKYATGPTVVVISAMGKTTNALEQALDAWWANEDALAKFSLVKEYHFDVLKKLGLDSSLPVWKELGHVFQKIETRLQNRPINSYDTEYDYIVSHGEIVSTKIISAYLNYTGFPNQWIDARDYIITNSLHRQARVEWGVTEARIAATIPEVAAKLPIITQGFIAGTENKTTTTLGREGSDFSASIFAYCLDANELVIWKDVPGVLNADPKKFEDTVKFDRLSYQDAVEMTYYGATVLHPKTIKPLQNKNIPLRVRSFLRPELPGTLIGPMIGEDQPAQVPIMILKESQLLVSLSTRDYSFMAEEAIEMIFDEVVRHGMKVNVMRNSAISFQMCMDDRGRAGAAFLEAMEKDFEINVQSGMELLTVKYPTPALLHKLLASKKIHLELRSGDMVQYVVD